MSNALKLKNYINGEWVESKATKYEDVYNPATKEVIGQVPLSTKEEVDEAVEVAKKLLRNGKTSLFLAVQEFYLIFSSC